MNMKKTLAVFVASLAFLALADATVSDVTVRQRWPFSRLVDIDYKLTGETGGRSDITLSATNEGKPVTLTAAALSGDLVAVPNGTRRITWDPAADGFTDDALAQFRVTVSAQAVPAYLIIDLTTGEKTYRYDWTDLTWCNADEYKKTKMVFRHIVAGSFVMGSSVATDGEKAANDMPLHQVNVSKDFWMAVFETTQKQYTTLMGNDANPSQYGPGDTLPVENLILLSQIRGSSSYSQPSTQFSSEVGADTFCGKLAALAEVQVDLPWEYQWEYACRAGTHAPYYMKDIPYNAGHAVLDRYFNFDKANSAPVAVGSYEPNPWGLYDMIGNVWDMTLDGYKGTFPETLPEATDEFIAMDKGFAVRTMKGGNFATGASFTRCATRADFKGFQASNINEAAGAAGFRVIVKY